MRFLICFLLALSASALAASGMPLHLTHKGTTVTVTQGNKVLWTRVVNGTPYNLPDKLNGPALGVSGQVAFVTYCWRGQRIYCQTAGFNKRTGQPYFDAPGVPKAIGISRLFINHQTHPADAALDAVEGTRVDLMTGRAERVNFRIPSRPGCGELNYTRDQDSHTTFDGTYAYAEQDDECGVFIAKFDWHLSNQQKPIQIVKSNKPAQR